MLGRRLSVGMTIEKDNRKNVLGRRISVGMTTEKENGKMYWVEGHKEDEKYVGQKDISGDDNREKEWKNVLGRRTSAGM